MRLVNGVVGALLTFLGFALFSSAGAAGEVFTATDLAGVSGIFLAFLAVGAAITIAMTLYKKGKQGASKV